MHSDSQKKKTQCILSGARHGPVCVSVSHLDSLARARTYIYIYIYIYIHTVALIYTLGVESYSTPNSNY
jgi:hypothetical protein